MQRAWGAATASERCEKSFSDTLRHRAPFCDSQGPYRFRHEVDKVCLRMRLSFFFAIPVLCRQIVNIADLPCDLRGKVMLRRMRLCLQSERQDGIREPSPGAISTRANARGDPSARRKDFRIAYRRTDLGSVLT